MSGHVILVAFHVLDPEDDDYSGAEDYLTRRLPRPGADSDDGSGRVLDSWWVAEDAREDGSDNDSAVFVTPGMQRRAVTLLHRHGMTGECNMTQGIDLGTPTERGW